MSGPTRTMPAALPAGADRRIRLTLWEGAGFPAGTGTGVIVDGGLRLAPAKSDGRWVSPWVTVSFGFTELITSWNADTPPGSMVEIAADARCGSDRTGWLVLGRWSSSGTRRTSVPGQAGAGAKVATDTLVAAEGVRFGAFRLRVRLTAADDAGPTVALLAGVVSDLPVDAAPAPDGPVAEATGMRSGGPGVELDVPCYSQERHRGRLPEFGGGGASWCSPTSVAMVLDRLGLGPSAEETAWTTGSARPQVEHAARAVYDPAYGGCGNWAFNTAYAGERGARAYLTRLRSLDEAERLVRAGIAPICSVAFRADELDGAGYHTAGHLLVVRGFTAAGDVIVNDPKSHSLPADDQVRTVYRRDQFERAWLSRSGGLVYVITEPDRRLPAPPVGHEPNWG